MEKLAGAVPISKIILIRKKISLIKSFILIRVFIINGYKYINLSNFLRNIIKSEIN